MFAKLLTVGIIAVTICIIALSSQLLTSRYAYQIGFSYLRQNKLSEAEKSLARALNYLPGSENSIFFNDLLRIVLAFGELYTKESTSAVNIISISETLKMAEIFYQLAVKINPLDTNALSGLASTEAALQHLPLQLRSKKEPIDVKSLFERAMILRPNGISMNYQYLKYLATQDNGKVLRQKAEKLAEIYPPSYAELQKESFFSQDIRIEFQKGIDLAIQDGKFLREAYSTKSTIALEDNDLEQAVVHFEAFLEVFPKKNSGWQHIRMGDLYLKVKDVQKAQEHFIKGLLLVDDREKALREIYAHYDSMKMYQPFLSFANSAEEKIPPVDLIHILVASSFIELNQDDFALARLARVESGKFGAESNYYKAVIAEKAEDWKAMEHAVQRAIVLDTTSSKYRIMFSQALHMQKKYEQAEIEANGAISISTKRDHQLFNHRGWIRWDREDYKGAIRDWKRASRLEPDIAAYHFQLSLAYIQIKNRPGAKRYAKKALEIDPENTLYSNHLKNYKKFRVDNEMIMNQINLYNRTATAFLFAILIFTPLARGGVDVWFQTLIVMATVLAIVVLLLERVNRGEPDLIRTELFSPILVLLIWFIVSLIFSQSKTDGVDAGFLLFTYAGIFYVAVNCIRTRKQQRMLVYVMLLSTFFVIIFGCFQRFGVNPFPWWQYKILDYDTKILSSTFGNHNHLAGLLGMMLPLLLGLFLTRPRRGLVFILMVCFSLIIVAAHLLTLSKTGWWASSISLLFMAIILLIQKRFRKKIILLLIIASVSFILFFILTGTQLVERMIILTEQENVIGLYERRIAWSGTFEMISDHLLTGSGPGSFATIFTQYQPSGVAARFYYAHNDYLHFIAELGLAIIPIMLWFLFIIFKTGIRKCGSSNRQTWGVTLGAMTGCVALLIHSVNDFNLHIPANAIFFTVLVALIMSDVDNR